MLTDNEIVKALETWLEEICKSHQTSLDLGYVAIATDIEDSICLMRGTIDLINRQKAEVEMNDAEIKELRIALQGYLDDVTKARNLYKQSIEELNQANAEIERLRNHIQEGIDLAKQIPKMMELVKSEAYRKFAELLKQRKYQSSDWSHGEHPYVVEESDIDNILNELVGEDDE